MAAPNLTSWVRRMAPDVILLTICGLVVPIMTMIHHEPGSNAYCLIWEPEKIYASLVTMSCLFMIFAVFRWKKWRGFWKNGA